jgi:hypothetical protein
MSELALRAGYCHRESQSVGFHGSSRTWVSLFWIMPLAQTWLLRVTVLALSPAIIQHSYNIPVSSRQGRPHIVQMSGSFKMVYID